MSAVRPCCASALIVAWASGASGTVQHGDAVGAVRDPFVSPRREPPAVAAVAPNRVEGLEGVSTSEIVVRGILYGVERSVAIVQGSGTGQLIVRPGDRLRDGRVHSIDAGGLVIAVANGRPPASGGAGLVRKRVGEPLQTR